MPGSSSATDRGNDFDAVARGEGGQRMAAFRDDFTIAFDGDALALEREFAHQISDCRGRDATNMNRTVDHERKHANASTR